MYLGTRGDWRLLSQSVGVFVGAAFGDLERFGGKVVSVVGGVLGVEGILEELARMCEGI